MPEIMDFLPVGGVGVDIGAEPDKDDWTGRMLQRVGASGTVYAFEPDPSKFAYLKTMYGAYPNAVLEQKAAAERDGPVAMVRGGTHVSLVYEGAADLIAEGVTLDSYFMGRSLLDVFTYDKSDDDVIAYGRIDLLKIDVEGGEYRVLQGARQTIQANPQIVIALEIHPLSLQNSGVSLRDLVSLLDELDLFIGEEYGIPMTEGMLATTIEGQQLVAWRKDRGL